MYHLGEDARSLNGVVECAEVFEQPVCLLVVEVEGHRVTDHITDHLVAHTNTTHHTHRALNHSHAHSSFDSPPLPLIPLPHMLDERCACVQ